MSRRRCFLALLSAVALAPILPGCVSQQRKTLRPLADNPLIFLNHLLVTVDSATYAAVGRSDFLRDTLAGFEQRTTFREGGRSYTATYLYGQHTYFELFQPDAARTIGRSGLALGVDRAGEIAAVRARLLTLAGNDSSRVPQNTNTRQQKDRQGVGTTPWYISTAVLPLPRARSVTDAIQPALFMWVMEFHPEFLERWAPDNAAAKLAPGYPVSRAAVRSIEYRPERLLADVIDATFALDSAESADILSELAALGYKITRQGAGRAEAVGPDVTFHVEPSDAVHRGLVALAFALNRPVRAAEYSFGARSRLVIEGRRASWTF